MNKIIESIKKHEAEISAIIGIVLLVILGWFLLQTMLTEIESDPNITVLIQHTTKVI